MRAAVLLLAGVAACGRAAPAPASAVEPASTSATPASEGAGAAASVEPAAPASARTLPTACASNDGGMCLPEADFAKRMCNGSFPDVALALMAKGSPFTRMFVSREVDGWNAEGGASARAKLSQGEEVLALRKRAAPKNGIVVGAGDGYLVMRWDGNCYTLDDTEVSARKPATAKHAPIAWRFLSDGMRDALLKNAKILAAFQKRGKECKGAVSGEVSKACESSDAALSAAIVTELRAGLSIPSPTRIP